MPRTTFDPKNRSESAFSYPKLKLAKQDRARIIVIDKEPLMEFVHTLKAPQIVNGKLVTKPTADGIPKAEEDFLGRYICAGAPEVLADKGRAPDTCPICEVAAESDAVDWPIRRFAMHIIQYTNLKPGSFELSAWGISIKAWLFTDRTFNTLVSFAEDLTTDDDRKKGKTGDIRLRDLFLGPCENEMFQKFDIHMSSQQGMWLRKEEFKAQVKELYHEGQTPHLEELIGRRGQEQMREDLQRVILRSRQAYGGDVSSEDDADATFAADALLSGDEVPADAPADEVLGVDLDLPGDDAAPGAVAPAPTGLTEDDPLGIEEAKLPAAEEGDSPNGEAADQTKAEFDDLLDDLPSPA